jgi:hypothetical protein
VEIVPLRKIGCECKKRGALIWTFFGENSNISGI